MENRSLSDFLVIDFTDGEYGATCAEYLALVGMNVVRIDAPRAEKLAAADRYAYIVNNLNKKSVSIDVETPEGRELVWRLIDKADVFIHNRTAAKIEALGFTYDAARIRNPRLVYCNIPAFGTGSPWQDVPFSEATVSAAGGGTYLCGYIGGLPVEPGPNLPNISSCGFAVSGICAALYQRELIGEGQYIEVAQQEAVIAHARSAFESYANNGRNIRVGNAFPTVPDMIPMDLFRTKGDNDSEDYAVIGCLGEPMWKQLATAMGREDLLTDPRFAEQSVRAQHKDELTEIISEWASQYTKFELMDYLLRKNRVVCAAVYTIKDVIEAEDLREMGLIQKIDDPELGEMWYPAFPAIYSDLPIRAESPGEIGSGNEAVLSAFGLSDAEIEDLAARNVIGPKGGNAQ